MSSLKIHIAIIIIYIIYMAIIVILNLVFNKIYIILLSSKVGNAVDC